MKNISRLSRLMVLTALMSGCSSSVQTIQYYQLPNIPPHHATQAEQRLVVEPVQVAAFLNTNALVFQQSEVELVPTQQHQWAEPLAQQLTRNLQASLSQLLPGYQVSTVALSPQDLRLTVQVSQFQISADHQVLIGAQVYLLSAQGLKQQSVQLTLPLSDDGYPAAVTTLGMGWTQLAEQISKFL